MNKRINMKKKSIDYRMTGMVGSHMADFFCLEHRLGCFGMQRWRSPLDNIMHLIPRINVKDACMWNMVT